MNEILLSIMVQSSALLILFSFVYFLFKPKHISWFQTFLYILSCLILDALFYLFSVELLDYHYLVTIFIYSSIIFGLLPIFFKVYYEKSLMYFVFQYVIFFISGILFYHFILPFFDPSQKLHSAYHLANIIFFTLSCIAAKKFWNRWNERVQLKGTVFIFPVLNLMFIDTYLSHTPLTINGSVLYFESVVIILASTLFLVYVITKLHNDDDRLMAESVQKDQMKKLQQEYYDLSKEYSNLRIIEHDIKNQLLTIEILRSQGQYKKAKKLSESLIKTIENLENSSEENI